MMAKIWKWSKKITIDHQLRRRDLQVLQIKGDSRILMYVNNYANQF